MKIFRIISLSALGLFLAFSACSAWTIDNGMMQPGNYTFMIKTTDYEKGIYFFQLKIADQLKNGKIIRSE